MPPILRGKNYENLNIAGRANHARLNEASLTRLERDVVLNECSFHVRIGDKLVRQQAHQLRVFLGDGAGRHVEEPCGVEGSFMSLL
ncbi:MAG: hypothetical protein ACXWJW_09525 [Xanthobacteraceae bacterium]